MASKPDQTEPTGVKDEVNSTNDMTTRVISRNDLQINNENDVNENTTDANTNDECITTVPSTIDESPKDSRIENKDFGSKNNVAFLEDTVSTEDDQISRAANHIGRDESVDTETTESVVLGKVYTDIDKSSPVSEAATNNNNADTSIIETQTSKGDDDKDDEDDEDDLDDEDGEDDDDEEDDEEEEDDDDEDDDGDEPPLLKYSRIKNLFVDLPKRDSISTCCFGETFFAFGTHMGLLHITKPDFSAIKTLKCHRSSILCINIESDTIATASIDGTVMIISMDDLQNLTAYDFKRPANAVALHSNYSTNKLFISGGMAGDVILTQRNWLGNRSDIILDSKKGPIMGIFIVDDMLIWMNDDGITICDIPSRTIMLTTKFPIGFEYERPDLFKPFLHKIDTDRFMVGWGRHLWAFKFSKITDPKNESAKLVSLISSAASSLKITPEKNVVLESHHCLDQYLAGIASFKGDQLMCLGFPVSENNDPLKGILPQISIIDLWDASEIYSNDIVTKDYDKSNLNDYHLGVQLNNDINEYYLISKFDYIKIDTLTLKDHYDWYYEKKNYTRAWEVGKVILLPHSLFDLGVKAVNDLIHKRQILNALEMSRRVFDTIDQLHNLELRSDNDVDWGKLYEPFLQISQAYQLSDFLPNSERIPSQIYEKILSSLIDNNKIEDLKDCIIKWGDKITNIETIETKLLQLKSAQQTSNSKKELIDSLVSLNLKAKRFSKVIPYMIENKDDRIFEILVRNKLTSHFLSDITSIILVPLGDKDINKLDIKDLRQILKKSTDFICTSLRTIRLSYLIERLSADINLSKLKLVVLEDIFTRDPSLLRGNEDTMVELYALCDPPKLLPFLKEYDGYSNTKAIDICKGRKDLYHELIYLLGRVGETKRALSIIIDELNDPQLAIQFVKSWGDQELLDFMIGYSLDKPDFVIALLQCEDQSGNMHVKVLKGVPENLEIEGIAPILKNMTKEDMLEIVSKQILASIVEEDTENYAKDWIKYRKLGRVFDVH